MSDKKDKKRLFLLDAQAILHRAYHALPDFSSSKGEPTGALYGVSLMLLKIINELKPDFIVACFDVKDPTYRHVAYDAYKAGRKKTDDDLVFQIDKSKEIFESFGVPVYEKSGFEADDLLGTITEKLKNNKEIEIIIASGDMDTMQLVEKNRVSVYTLKKGIKDTIIYDEKAVEARFGFEPGLLPDFKGLRGDPSDNIIGIKGIGEKTATDLIKNFGTIEEIYKKLTQGESFKSLAKQFSDDKNSAPNGGKLKPFSGGQIRAKAFEDVAFNLEKEGDVSEPFKTEFGWHIVKLHKITNVPSFEEMKPELVEKVKRDDRSKLIDEALTNKLKLKYNIGVEPNLEYFVSILNNDYFKRTWSLPDNFNGRESLIKIGDKQFTNNDFAVYLLNTQRQRTKEAPFETLVSEKYQSFLKESLIKYQEDHLESENEDYANIVAEYRDGLLLFDLMENTIWNSSKSDSIEIERFYEKNKANYFKPERINAVVAVSTKQKTLKKVSKLLSKNMKLDQIKSLVNGNDKIDVIFTSDVMDAEHQALPEAFEFKKGVSKIYKHNDSFVVVKVNEVLPKEQKSFNEAKGKVISDYQNYKEEKWLNDLKAKYVVKVNEDVLSDIKSKQKQ